MVSRDKPISPRCTPCILLSRIGSAIPHRVNSRGTNSVNYIIYSRSHAFQGGNQTLSRKNPTYLVLNPRSPHPKGDSRTLYTAGARRWTTYHIVKNVLGTVWNMLSLHSARHQHSRNRSRPLERSHHQWRDHHVVQSWHEGECF